MMPMPTLTPASLCRSWRRAPLWCLSGLLVFAIGCGGVQFEKSNSAPRYAPLPSKVQVQKIAKLEDVPAGSTVLGVLRLPPTRDPMSQSAAERELMANALRYGCDVLAEMALEKSEVVNPIRVKSYDSAGNPVWKDDVETQLEHSWVAKCVRTPMADIAARAASTPDAPAVNKDRIKAEAEAAKAREVAKQAALTAAESEEKAKKAAEAAEKEKARAASEAAEREKKAAEAQEAAEKARKASESEEKARKASEAADKEKARANADAAQKEKKATEAEERARKLAETAAQAKERKAVEKAEREKAAADAAEAVRAKKAAEKAEREKALADRKAAADAEKQRKTDEKEAARKAAEDAKTAKAAADKAAADKAKATADKAKVADDKAKAADDKAKAADDKVKAAEADKAKAADDRAKAAADKAKASADKAKVADDKAKAADAEKAKAADAEKAKAAEAEKAKAAEAEKTKAAEAEKAKAADAEKARAAEAEKAKAADADKAKAQPASGADAAAEAAKRDGSVTAVVAYLTTYPTAPQSASLYGALQRSAPGLDWLSVEPPVISPVEIENGPTMDPEAMAQQVEAMGGKRWKFFTPKEYSVRYNLRNPTQHPLVIDLESRGERVSRFVQAGQGVTGEQVIPCRPHGAVTPKKVDDVIEFHFECGTDPTMRIVALRPVAREIAVDRRATDRDVPFEVMARVLTEVPDSRLAEVYFRLVDEQLEKRSLESAVSGRLNIVRKAEGKTPAVVEVSLRNTSARDVTAVFDVGSGREQRLAVARGKTAELRIEVPAEFAPALTIKGVLPRMRSMEWLVGAWMTPTSRVLIIPNARNQLVAFFMDAGDPATNRLPQVIAAQLDVNDTMATGRATVLAAHARGLFGTRVPAACAQGCGIQWTVRLTDLDQFTFGVSRTLPAEIFVGTSRQQVRFAAVH